MAEPPFTCVFWRKNGTIFQRGRIPGTTGNIWYFGPIRSQIADRCGFNEKINTQLRENCGYFRQLQQFFNDYRYFTKTLGEVKWKGVEMSHLHHFSTQNAIIQTAKSVYWQWAAKRKMVSISQVLLQIREVVPRVLDESCF